MKVIIPVAGKGTRLRPHTHVTPKPLLRVADKPVLSYILDDLRELGVNDAVFITGHLKERIQAFMQREHPEFRSVYVEQVTQAGTADAIGLAESHVDEDVLIIFADTLFDADLGVVRRLPQRDAGVIWAKEVEDYQRFGVVITDAQGYMQRIVEKPKEPVSKLANIGLYYIRDHKLLFEGIHHVMNSAPGPSGEFYLTDAFQYMVDHGARIKVEPVQGWYDVGKPETWLETNRHAAANLRPRRPEDAGVGVTIREPVHIAEGVEMRDSEIGPNVTLGRGTKVFGSTLRDVIAGENARIEESELRESLIGNDASVFGLRGSADLGDHGIIDARG